MNIDKRCCGHQPAQTELAVLRAKAAKFDALAAELRERKHEFEQVFAAEELAEMPEYSAMCELNKEMKK